MGNCLNLKKIGNSYYLSVPIKLVRKQKWKYGDIFEIEDDIMTPTYNLKKIGNNGG